MTATTIDATEVFFNDLSQRRHDPLLEQITGSFCFDLTQGDQSNFYQLTVTKGDMVVSHERGQPDCMIKADRSLFNRIILGESNELAAAMRGDLTIQGDPALIVLLFRRLFCRADKIILNHADIIGSEGGRS